MKKKDQEAIAKLYLEGYVERSKISPIVKNIHFPISSQQELMKSWVELGELSNEYRTTTSDIKRKTTIVRDMKHIFKDILNYARKTNPIFYTYDYSESSYKNFSFDEKSHWNGFWEEYNRVFHPVIKDGRMKFHKIDPYFET